MLTYWWLVPVLELGFNYFRWQVSDIENYEVYLFRSELLRGTDYIEPYNYQTYDDEGILRGDYPAYIFNPNYDAVSILFNYAWTVTWNPFDRCEVNYDEIYGFPNLISCGLWQQIQTFDFQPINE